MRFGHTLSIALLVIGGTQCHAQSSAEELARVLGDKQIISAGDFDRIAAAGSSGGTGELAAILRDKGVITAAEAASLHANPSPSPTQIAPTANTVATVKVAKPADPGSDANRQLTLYGTLLFNAFFNDAGSNNSDIPSFAVPKTFGAQENFGATARQTRLGLSYAGLTVAGANISGTVEADFFGGAPALTNGINMDVIRMRLAYGRLDWKHFAIEAGQDWTIFAPLNPTSLAEFAVPEFSSSGNLWIRTPQIRVEWKGDLGKRRTFLLQTAVMDPDIGDNPAAFSTARQPRAGELGRLPAVETRLALSGPMGGRTATIGLSGHWGAAKNTGVTNGFATSRSFESWGAAVDFSLPFAKLLNISGEVYAGRALGVFSGGIAQTMFALGQPGDHGVGSRGGWLQLQSNFTKKWQTNIAYGIDAPTLSNLPDGIRSKNQSYMGNLIYHFSPNVAFALEGRRFLTNYLNQRASNNQGDHFNIAAAYTF